MEPDNLETNQEEEKIPPEAEFQQQEKQKEQISSELEFRHQSLVVILFAILILEIGILVYALQAGQKPIVVISPEKKAILTVEKAEKDLKTAQQLADEATNMIKEPPLPLVVWEKAQAKLQEAIKTLEGIPKDIYLDQQVQKQLEIYRKDAQVLKEKLILEQTATAKLAAAKKLGIEASAMLQNPPYPLEVWQEAQMKWQESINLLKEIPPDAFVASEALEKLELYQVNYEAITNRLKREKDKSSF